MELSTCQDTLCSNFKLCLSDTNGLWNYALFMIIDGSLMLDLINVNIYFQLFHSNLAFLSSLFCWNMGTTFSMHLLPEHGLDESKCEVSKQVEEPQCSFCCTASSWLLLLCFPRLVVPLLPSTINLPNPASEAAESSFKCHLQ